MSDDFFRSAMGRRFYESTMPKIGDELARLNRNLEALFAKLQDSSRRDDTAKPADPL